MPIILEIKEIDGDIWCRIGKPGEFESGVEILTPDEQKKAYSKAYNHGFGDCGEEIRKLIGLE